MLLDKLLRNIVVHVDPFAACLLDLGWRLRLPGPPDAMFHFVLQGSGYITGANGERHRLERFCLAIVPKGSPHSLECGTNVASEVEAHIPSPAQGIARFVAGNAHTADLRVACGVVGVMYGDSLGLFQRLDNVLVVDLSDYPQVRYAFEALLQEQGSGQPGSEALSVALMNQCLVYLFRHLAEQPADELPWIAGIEDPTLAGALDEIFEHPERPHTVESLAETVALSRSAFSQRFHAAFGTSPMNFVHDVRMRRAAELLEKRPDLSVERVVKHVGFNSRSHFNQEFRTRFGVTPAAFRATGPSPN